MSPFEELAQFVLSGNAIGVEEQVKQLIKEAVDPREIINQGLIGGMNIVGPLFKNGEMYVPEVLMSARAMKVGMELVKPLIADGDMPAIGKVVIGTVKGDLHDIGKNLVSMMMESAGFAVANIGVDINPVGFVEAIKKYQPDIVAISALLTTTMPAIQETIEVFKNEGIRDKIKVIVGGAPVSQEFATKIGADGFAEDAASATDLCKQLLNI